MANGQERAQQNVFAFDQWVATQTDDDFRQIVHRGQLNRGEVAKAIGCGKSALRQNPALRDRLEQLEIVLRDREVLPEESASTKAKSSEPKEYDSKKTENLLNASRLSSLEAELVELKTENKQLKARLARYEELSEAMTDWGFLPQ